MLQTHTRTLRAHPLTTHAHTQAHPTSTRSALQQKDERKKHGNLNMRALNRTYVGNVCGVCVLCISVAPSLYFIHYGEPVRKRIYDCQTSPH